MPGILILLGAVFCVIGIQGITQDRVKRQNPQNGQVIDDIFKIPITAIKQTAAAAQLFAPENTQTIDSVFKIPISTLEAVGNLVKSTSAQRRLNAEGIQQMRQDRKQRQLAQRERQRLQKEEIQNKRIRQQELKRTVRHFHKDPFGLNALTNLLVGHHGILNGHGHHGGLGGFFISHGVRGGGGGHGGHGTSGGHGEHFGGHVGGNGESNGNIGGNGNSRPQWFNEQQNSYAVHENVNENGSPSWFEGPTDFKIENKIAPKNDRTNHQQTFYALPVEHRSTSTDGPEISTMYDEDFFTQEKFTQRSDRVSFQ